MTAKLISAFDLASLIVQFLYFLNPKFPVSSHLLCLYSLVYVGPGRNPNCWFSHAQAHVVIYLAFLANVSLRRNLVLKEKMPIYEAEALPGVWGIQGEGLFIFRDLGRRVIYFQGFGEHNFLGF